MQHKRDMQKVQLPSHLPGGQTSPLLECNLRLITIAGGAVVARRLRIRTASSGVEFPAALCSRLRRQHGLIVAPSPGIPDELILLDARTFEETDVAGDGWRAIVADCGERHLDLASPEDAGLLALLIERGLARSYERMSGYFRTSTSTRYWCRGRADRSAGGIEMLPLVSFATLPIPELGVGVVLGIGHLLRTQNALDYYFDPRIGSEERSRRLQEFDALRARGDRRKGTLLYDTGSRMMSHCYYVHDGRRKTCGEVGPLEVRGISYSSLFDYYKKVRPSLKVAPEEPAVYVSFSGLKGDKPVAARLLRLRVMLEPIHMPKELRTSTTLGPEVRRRLTEREWDSIPKRWLADAGLRLSDSFWSPDEAHREVLPPPKLVFGRGREVDAPRSISVPAYMSYFKVRRELLQEVGVQHYDEDAGRNVILVTPPESPRWSGALQKDFVQGLVASVSTIAGRRLQATVVRGERLDDIVEQLRGRERGNALIVFDDRDRAAYAVLSHELSGWSLKRITRRKVEERWTARLVQGDERKRTRAIRDWKDLLFHSAVDFLDQMRAVPWRLREWQYEACLTIDVSEGRRYFGLSVLLCRSQGSWPSFKRVTRTWPKGDHQHETIERSLLADKIGALLPANGSGWTPLTSLLVLRDGREFGDELAAVHEGVDRWKRAGLVAADADVDIVDVLKRSAKGLRLWYAAGGSAENVIEGQAVYLDDRTALVCCTGAATLDRRGTSEPILLRTHGESDITRAARGVFALSQLNYSSPTKAQRCPQPLHEVDSMLRARVDADMRGIK